MTPRAVLAAGLLLLACNGCPRSRGTDWPDDPKSDDAIRASCAAAGATLERLSCATRRPDFDSLCVYYVSRGVPLHPQCIAAATSCREADAC